MKAVSSRGRDAGRRRAGEAVAGFDPLALRRARLGRGLTLDALGARCGCTRASLIAYEKGSRRPGIDTLRAMAAALDCSVDALAPSGPGPATYAELRVRAGLTKTELATRLGLSRTTWDAVERGLRPASPDLARRVAICLSAEAGDTGGAVPAPGTPAARPLPAEGSSNQWSRAGAPGRAAPGSLQNHLLGHRFVGRATELLELRAVLGDARLLTLVGSPGVGKTCLAVQLGIEAGDAHPDGVWFVPLAGTGDPGLVPQALATALGIREQRGRSLTETLCTRLAEARLLLIVDSCEHLAEAVAELAARLLDACPGISMLATSQRPLGTEDERVWKVRPLEVPGPDESQDPPEGTESVRLFCEMARAHHADFVLSRAMRPAVAEICRRLEGVPLAIQLTAARISVLTPDEILDRLGDPPRLLSGGAGGSGQSAVTDALDRSYELLPAEEQALLRHLSVFASGCGIDGIETVCGESDRDHPSPRLVDSLATLVSRSLVISDTSGRRARYRLLEPVREYAAARAEAAGETGQLRTRHLRWCGDLAEAASAGLVARDQLDWLERVELEHDNLRAGLRWAIARGEAREALRLAAGLTVFWRVRGHFREGRDWLRAALDMPGARGLEGEAAALRGLGFLCSMMQETEAAMPALERAFQLSLDHQDAAGAARSLLLAGNARAVNDPAAPVVLFERSAALARGTGDVWCLGHALAMEARGRLRLGDTAAATALLDECVTGARATGELQSLRMGLFLQGTMARMGGDLDAAEARFTEGLGITRRLGEPFDTAAALQALGDIAALRGHHEAARGLLMEALTVARHTDDPGTIARCLEGLGAVYIEEGDGPSARASIEESIAVSQAAHLAVELPTRAGLGMASALAGDATRARAILTETLDGARDRGDRRVAARCLAALGELSRKRGGVRVAEERLREALSIRGELGDPHDIADSLELLAALSVDCARWEEATRLLAGAQGVRDRSGCGRSGHRQALFDHCRQATESARGRLTFSRDWERGIAMSTTEVVASARGRGSSRSATGWSSLTPAEQRVAAMVVEGLANTEIAEKLSVTRSTVEGHVSHVLAKLGLHTRAQLIREGVIRQLVE